jgi:CRISPR-associated protein (TIGR03986 family)
MIPKHSQSKTPTHTSPTQEDRTAHAPYNFVALPKQAQPVDSPVAQVDQSRYDDALLTGQIQCEFETKSPLYTRCLMSPEFFREYGDKKFHELTQAQREERAQFYQQHSNPVVPGSSLRGMIRTLVEIISFGKFLDVTDKQLVFRAVAEGKNTTALGAYYSKLAKNGMAFKAKAGYMTQNNGIWHICPASVINGVSFARVKCDATRIFSLPKHKNSCNAYGPIYFAPNPVASGKNMLVTTVQDKKAADLQAGVLVKSGKMGGKKHDYIVFSSDATQTLIEIPFELEQNYRQQISREQRELLQGFDKHDEAIGVLQVDQPVFYLTYEDKLVYFGHLPLMRLPYEKKPLDLVPKPLRSPTHIDLAEKLFGYVGKGNKGKYEQDALAGRVFFSDAVLAPDQTNVWYSDKPVVPQILSGPKPTSFQLYLTQQQPDDKLKLQHYDSSDTTLRGYKLYWHKGEKPAFEEKKDEMDVIDEKTWTIRNESGQPVPDTQHTLIKPVKAGVKFTFTIRFENLHPVELGALLWAIEPTPFARNRSICHKLGMGKPLGLGSIQIFDVQVKVDDRVQRYQSLFDENGWGATRTRY